MPVNLTKCNEESGCFGMVTAKNGKDILCTVLSSNYKKGECPFKKEKRYVTKGKTYPIGGLRWPSKYEKRERRKI